MPLRSRDLDHLGVSRSRVRASDVTQPFRGVHLVGRPAEAPRDRVRAFVPLLREHDAFSHSTAALLYGAPLPARVETEHQIHVTTVGGDDRFRRRGVVGHRASQLDVRAFDGLPVAAPAEVWLQLATRLSHDDLVAVGDFIVTPPRRHAGALSSIDELAATVASRSGARGARRARAALASVRVGPRSRMETLLRLLLLRSGLPEPLLNPPMRIGDQALHPDLAFPQWRVVLGYEGDQHRTDAEQWRHDIWRREAFESAGWRVVRVHRDDVLGQPRAFIARLCHILAARP